MKIGIIGLPQVGKKLIFGLLTGKDVSGEGAEPIKEPVHGIVTVKDSRLDRVVSAYTSKKKTPARIETVLMPKLEKDYIKSGRLFEHLEDADALCHIVRAFADDTVYHAEGSPDAARDIDSVNAELILGDLMFIEKRLEKIDRESTKKPDKRQQEEKALLLRFKQQLEGEMPLRLLELKEAERKIVASYPFMTLKPVLIALNAGEGDADKRLLSEEFIRKYESQGVYFTRISAKIEYELSRLDSEKEKNDFLRELGIKEPAIGRFTRILYEALGLISFFTAAENEARAWMIKKGSTAPEAAGAIHSDMQRGFIRAEVVKYDDLTELGSEAKVKEAGRFMIKGKDYIVADGDILNIRFSA